MVAVVFLRSLRQYQEDQQRRRNCLHCQLQHSHQSGLKRHHPAPRYDLNGNQLNLTATSETVAWNAANQPVSINGVTATYDASGRMVETYNSSSGVAEQFVFRPSGDLLAVYNATTLTLVKGTVPLPGGETAIYNSGGLNYIRHTDWLGSSRFSTKWDHSVYAKESYAPFGETYIEAGTPDRSFTGQDQDVISGSGGTGVYDYLFRKYDPSAGRWLSPDPKGWGATSASYPQSFNRYAYVQNNPMSSTDPDGQSCIYATGNGGVSIDDDPADIGQFCTNQGGIYTDGGFELGDLDALLAGNISFYIQDPNNDSTDSYYNAVQAGIDNRPGEDGTGHISADNSNLLSQMRDMIQGGDQGGDYLGNGADPALTNGNIIHYDPRATNGGNGQDGSCSAGNGALGQFMNGSPAILASCQAHDSFYENEHCNSSSWWTTFLFPSACGMANIELLTNLVPEFIYYGAKLGIQKLF